MAIVNDGRQASTLYRTNTTYRDCSLIDVRPKTGRTHQIRVHFTSIGHPIVGDETYGRADPRLDRQFLHAAYLEFEHPAKEADLRLNVRCRMICSRSWTVSAHKSLLTPDCQAAIRLC